MSDLNIIEHLAAHGINITTAILAVVVFNGVKVHRMERTMNAVVSLCAECPRRKKNPLTIPAFLAGVIALALLLSGCVYDKFDHGETHLTRTAVLTHVKVPSLIIATNGTMSASLDSDARTELIEALMKALATAPK